jgi:hypothetical protein
MSTISIPPNLPASFSEAYVQAAEKSILPALNGEVYPGYFSVCADHKGHGGDNTYPGLDWGQSAEALLWLGKEQEVYASWNHVKKFQREDGLLPFAIIPSLAGKTSTWVDGHTLSADVNGAVFKNWVPCNPLRTLANVTAILLADAIYQKTGNKKWLEEQRSMLSLAASWLLGQVTEEGLVHGAGFYIERPERFEYDGVNQCYTMHALHLAAQLLDNSLWQTTADRIAECFRHRFWAKDHCVEYIHPERGAVSFHGLTDVDWAACATGILSKEQTDCIWPQLKNEKGFYYGGMPSGIATKPSTYEDWEFTINDRLDMASMGRVWYLECWARSRMGDREGILESLRLVIERGQKDGWYWRERYTPDGQGAGVEKYCEYAANLIRICNRFL